jgi:uncharacterized protein
MKTLLGAVAACLALSCGGTPRATPPLPGPAPVVKTYAPLAAKADAKAPHQAVIHGTDARDGSTLVPLLVDTGRANVEAMFVKLGGEAGATGGMTPVKLATGSNAERSVQVGIYEEFAGGTGPQWRAGVWVSAFVASSTLNKDLTDFTFSASSGGYIDGASASGLMAGGFLAAITGAKVDPSVAVTGIINPDGTIGPVAGIPEKFAGSIEAGKKKLGYPIGMRMATSAKTGKPVDLVDLAQAHGVEAVELADVHDVYRLLTGKELPRPVPVAEADMALDAGTAQAVEVRYKEWQQRVAGEWSTIVQLESAGRLPPLLVALREYSVRHAAMAEQLHKQGLVGAAYARMRAAWGYAASTTQTYDILSKVRTGQVGEAVAALAVLDSLDELTRAPFDTIGALRPPTMGGHLRMMAAFRAAVRGWAYRVFATESLASTRRFLQTLDKKPAAELQSPQLADQIVAAVAPTVLYVARTIAETTLATQQLEFLGADDINYMCSLPNVKRMATSFQSAGAAGINYFDALLVQPFAQAARLSEDEARQRVALVEHDYLVAYLAARLGSLDGLPKELKAKWGENSLPWGLMSLAGSELAYYHAAELIAKHYSLGVKTDSAGQVQSIEHDKAFANMLATAERSARANARAARIASGAIPVQAKLSYQLAMAQRDGTLAEKLDALGQFWASSSYSQTAVMLARN